LTIPTIVPYIDGTNTLAENMSYSSSVDSSSYTTTCTLTFSPDDTQGSAPIPTYYYVRFRVCDELDDTLCVITPTVTFTVSEFVANIPPQFLSYPVDTTVIEWQTYETTIIAVDPDGDRVYLHCIEKPEDVEFNDRGDGTALFRFVPDYQYVDQTVQIVILARDQKDTTRASFQISVADFPLAIGQTAEEDDHLVDSPIVIRFNEPIDESSVSGNVTVTSAKGASPVVDHYVESGVSVLEIRSESQYFQSLDTIGVSIGTGVKDQSGNNLAVPYSTTYPTGTIVHPGDANNDGIVDERDILPIGLFFGRMGPDRADQTGVAWRRIPVHVRRGTEEWRPASAVYADGDGSGQVTKDDICAISENFGKLITEFDSTTVTSGFANVLLSELPAASVASLAAALQECPESEGRAALLSLLQTYDDPKNQDLPTTVELHQNYPNPFNPQTTIAFSIPTAAHVKLVVRNVMGRQVAVLVDEARSAGTHRVVWRGTDNAGRQVASGVYFYSLTVDGRSETGRMLLLK
jgi:hypothetical protein